MSQDTHMQDSTAEDIEQVSLDDPNVRISIVSPQGLTIKQLYKASYPWKKQWLTISISLQLQYKSQQSDPHSMSFQIENEDHTLGNALRYIIMRNPEVEFCGYSIPHPSEAKMNMRIQTYGTETFFRSQLRFAISLIHLHRKNHRHRSPQERSCRPRRPL